MSVTRLSGGLTPGDGGDPRTFPAIWNDTADAIDSLSIGTAVATAGQVLAFSTAVSGYVPEDVFGGAVNGTAVYRFVDTVYFTSNGTFTKADYPWLRAIRVKVQGSGGGGGGGRATTAGQFSQASGGGGGAYFESFITDIAGLDSSITVTCAAGGAGGVGTGGGIGGGASSFGALVTADGGSGGLSGFVQSSLGIPGRGGGTPGVSGTGDIGIPGLAGGFGVTYVGGNGGGSFLGGSSLGSPISANGVAGLGFGGGGSGASNAGLQADKTGGAGANGIVIVELYG